MLLRAANQEPIPGYKLLEPLGKGGFGEVWKCEAPGGIHKAVKFVRGSAGGLGDDSCAAEQEMRALQHVKSIRHPFLLSIERVESLDGDLVVVMELADRSLHDLLEECRAAGRAAVPRPDVLAYLREAAEVLDLMNHEHGLQHLDVKPRNLFLVGRHVKVADFGLVNSLAEVYANADRNDLFGAITPLYAAPEVFEGKVTLFSDQYSLAVSYQELVAGKLPYTGRNVRQLMLQIAGGQPDLSPLGELDRPVVAKALSKDPRERYPSCLDFVHALEQAWPEEAPRSRSRTTSYEIAMPEMVNTAVAPPDGSGLYRRRSRVMQAVRPIADAAPQDALSGYQLQECLSRSTLGELWRAAGPGGEPCLLRFLSLPDAHGNEALHRLGSLAHPLVPPLRVIEAGPGRVALMNSAGDSSLAARLKQSQDVGLPGIDRQELLQSLAQFAHALDELYHHHQIQHLALSPRHLALSRGSPLLLEFGLAEILLLPQGAQPATLNPRYAAVELLDGLISDACDQYSLALIYQEMLVGLHPFRSLNARQMTSSKGRGLPELSLLPAPDRAVVLQALSPDPEKRFRSCREFVMALEEISGFLPAVAPSQGSRRVAAVPTSNVGEWRPAVDEIVHAIARGHVIQLNGQSHYRLTPGVEIEQHFWARLPAGMAKLKMRGFCEQNRAEVLSQGEHRWLVEIPARTSLFQRCLGKAPGLLVEVTIGKPREAQGAMTPVRVRLEPRDCNKAKGDELLNSMGPAVLSSLQTYFGGQSSREGQERFPAAQAVHVQALNGVTVTGQTRDVGRDEMTVLSPCALPIGPIKLTINRWASPLTVQVPAQVRDCVAADAERYEVELGLG